jgi:dTDP-L-rhamnose 4-epimerase
VDIEHQPAHRAGEIEHACADLTRLASIGATSPGWSSRDAIVDFIQRSWDKPGAWATARDQALTELDQRSLTT